MTISSIPPTGVAGPIPRIKRCVAFCDNARFACIVLVMLGHATPRLSYGLPSHRSLIAPRAVELGRAIQDLGPIIMELGIKASSRPATANPAGRDRGR